MGDVGLPGTGGAGGAPVGLDSFPSFGLLRALARKSDGVVSLGSVRVGCASPRSLSAPRSPLTTAPDL